MAGVPPPTAGRLGGWTVDGRGAPMLSGPTCGDVLLVDDDPAISRLLELIFTDAGFHTVMAASAEAALERIDRGGIAGVVLDNHLPGMSGLELIRVLRGRETTLTLPV